MVPDDQEDLDEHHGVVQSGRRFRVDCIVTKAAHAVGNTGMTPAPGLDGDAVEQAIRCKASANSSAADAQSGYRSV